MIGSTEMDNTHSSTNRHTHRRPKRTQVDGSSVLSSAHEFRKETPTNLLIYYAKATRRRRKGNDFDPTPSASFSTPTQESVHTQIHTHTQKTGKVSFLGLGCGFSIQLIWLAACQVIPTNANLISKQESNGNLDL